MPSGSAGSVEETDGGSATIKAANRETVHRGAGIGRKAFMTRLIWFVTMESGCRTGLPGGDTLAARPSAVNAAGYERGPARTGASRWCLGK
ncbi:MAG: hypothetical protein NTNFB02_07940 [Nitrospira sp.]